MVDIKFENIIASCNLGQKLDLNEVSKNLEGSEYNPDRFPGVIYRFKLPRVVLLIFDSGKVMCTSARSVEDVEKVMIEIEKILKEKKLIS